MNTNNLSEEESTINESVIKALNHTIRRKLLLELYKHGWGGYSELSKVLNIKAGSFYHHMRILEQSELIKQLEDKLYEITPLGAQAAEFMKGSFSPLEEDRYFRLLNLYSPLSSMINSFPKFFLPIMILIYIVGGIWLAAQHQLSFLGFFILLTDEPSTPGLISLVHTFIGLMGVYSYFLTISNRVIPQINLASHLLFPGTTFIGLLLLISLLPASKFYDSIPPEIIVIFTIIYQIISISYYLHVFNKSQIREMSGILIISLLQQYYYLLILFLLP